MNPLQKKCIIATVGLHLLLLVILFLGPGFFHQQPPPDTLPVLKVIPLTAVDTALSSGSPPAAQPVTPQPPVVPPPTPTPAPEPPKPVVKPEPTPQPEPPPVVKPQPPEPVDSPKPVVAQKPEPEPDPTPEPKPEPVPKPARKIEANLTPVVHQVTKKPTHKAPTEDTTAADERAERAAAHRKALAISRLTSSLRDNLAASTEVEMPTGESSESYANFGQIVKSIYENAWRPPDSADNEEANPKVHVVIARDGSVISAHIIEPSGDAAVDASVRKALDRVTFIRPFPDGAKENERAYNIYFNLKAKRMNG